MTDSGHDQSILFEVSTPLDFSVRVTLSYWDLITKTKHPVMAGQEFIVSAPPGCAGPKPTSNLKTSYLEGKPSKLRLRFE
jgi:hypothetical protein